FNPAYLDSLSELDRAFVMAHEMLHLALRTHERGEGADLRVVNVAHDYIINDMLVHEMGQKPPAGVLYQDGARFLSLERLIAHFRRNPEKMPRRCLDDGKRRLSDVGRALADAGVLGPGGITPESWYTTDALD